MSQPDANAEGPWERHPIPAVGVSLEINRSWPLDVTEIPDGTVVTQRLPDGAGVVFLRYGPGQTLDRFLAGLGDVLTTVSTTGEETTAFAGQPARRVTLSLRGRGGSAGTDPDRPWHQPMAPPTTSTMVVTAFQSGDVPVLMGYRLRDDDLPTYQAIVERMVTSVTLTPSS